MMSLWILTALIAPESVDAWQSTTESNAVSTVHAEEERIQEAAHILSSLGIDTLCHPTTNRYAPTFPKCQLSRMEEVIERPERFLEEYYRESEDYELQDENSNEALNHASILINALMVIVCVMGGAVMAGLTIGLLSLDPLLLVIKARAGETDEERQQAASLLPIVKKHHQVMVSLLLLNTLAGEALPVFLQSMVPDSVAVFASVLLVLLFGEILPTAIFTGKHQLTIASRLAPLVKFIMFVMYPITYPIARFLDHILHEEEGDHNNPHGSDDTGADENDVHVPTTIFSRGELAALVRIQYDQRVMAKQRRKHNRVSSLASIPQVDTGDFMINSDVRALKTNLLQDQSHAHHNNSHRRNYSIDRDEVTMIEGALQMKTKTAIDVYLSYHKVFCVPNNMTLEDRNIFTIYASGYSRVPVYEKGDRRLVKGILMTRQLMVVKRQQQQSEQQNEQNQPLSTYETISDLNLHVPQCVAPHTNLVALVNLFQTGGSAVRAGHMALVCARPHIADAALDKGEGVPIEAGLMGIITLEDVLEALLQEDILDEMDAAGRRAFVEDMEQMESSDERMPTVEEIDPLAEPSTSYCLA